jgi:hypothetical protein
VAPYRTGAILEFNRGFACNRAWLTLLHAVLDRVKAFLPQIEAENKKLNERLASGEDVRIDHLTDEERFIEMVSPLQFRRAVRTSGVCLVQ